MDTKNQSNNAAPPITIPTNPVRVEIKTSIDLNTTWEQIKDTFTFSQKFNIVIINKTNNKLKRVGAYNGSSNWPIGDVEGETAATLDFQGSVPLGTAAIAANYKLENEDIYFQFGASWPYFRSRGIGLDKFNDTGNRPAEKLFENLPNPNDKNTQVLGYKGRAFIAQDGDNTIIWVFEVKPPA